MARPDPRDKTPLTPAALHIGLALSAGPLHGYAIMHEGERLTRARTSLGPGTLYRSLQRMLVDGLIAEIEDRPADDADDERRRYYTLTRFGRAGLQEESLRLRTLVRLATARGLIDERRAALRAPQCS